MCTGVLHPMVSWVQGPIWEKSRFLWLDPMLEHNTGIAFDLGCLVGIDQHLLAVELDWVAVDQYLDFADQHLPIVNLHWVAADLQQVAADLHFPDPDFHHYYPHLDLLGN